MMKVDHVSWTLFTIQIVLNDSACSFIMARDTFPDHGHERIEGYPLRVAIDGVDHLRGSDYIDLAIEHGQAVNGELASCTSVENIINCISRSRSV